MLKLKTLHIAEGMVEIILRGNFADRYRCPFSSTSGALEHDKFGGLFVDLIGELA